MTPKIRAAGAALLLLASLAACQDQPTASAPAPEPPAAPNVLAQLSCTADVGAATISCAPEQTGATAGGARHALVTVGGQHHYVRLANSGTVVDGTAGTFTTTVSVQNLLLAALGTEDGTTAHASGVRVFFATAPTSGVMVANATGQDLFLGSAQGYFQYSGAELGADAILSPDETSAGKAWTFATNGASSFSFGVYVQSHVPAGVAHTARFVQVISGNAHSCALTPEGTAYCWGSDVNGQLGNGTGLTANQGVPSPVLMPTDVSFSSITAGDVHTCALGSDAKTYCWGSDGEGRLGNGSTSPDQPSPFPVEMPTGVSFSSITAGIWHTCALGSDAKAYCWGNDQFGQLGNGSTLTLDQHSPFPVEMPAGVSFSSITAGSYHTCALGSDASAYCWGSDGAGRLGNGDTLTLPQDSPSLVDMPTGVTFSSITAGFGHTCALGSDDRAYCWGGDSSGQLGNGATLTASQPSPSQVEMPDSVSFSSITAGFALTCALGSDDRAYCWGRDSNGQLGNGQPLADQPSPSPVEMPAGVSFSSITAEGFHTCALGSGPAYCWGLNSSRQSGDGTTLNRAAPAVVAGTR
jgi:alpha-tubulin suppressor-like RCC1 family protein